MLLCHTALMVHGARDARPDAAAYVDDALTGARCHVQVEEHLDRCEPLLAALREAWVAQVDEWGWPAPFPDSGGGTPGLDIYIHSSAAGGAYVNSPYVDADPQDGRMGATSWMVLAPSIPTSEYPGYIAHEFNHVLQFAVDFTEPSLAPWEGTATLAEERTYPGEGSGPTTIPDYQATPWAGPLRDGYWLEELGYWSWYEYGSVLLMQWLEDVKGGSMPELWLAMSNSTWTNEPDFLDVLTQELWREFSVWRATLADYPVGLEATLSVGEEHLATRVQPWGVIYVDVTEPGVLVAESTGARLIEVIEVTETRFAVIDWGEEGFDGDDTLKGSELRVRLEAPDAPHPDSGDSGVPGGSDAPRCGGCDAPAGGPSWILLILAALRRRRLAGP